MSYLECGMLQIHKIDHVKCGTLNWQDLKKIEKKLSKTKPGVHIHILPSSNVVLQLGVKDTSVTSIS